MSRVVVISSVIEAISNGAPVLVAHQIAQQLWRSLAIGMVGWVTDTRAVGEKIAGVLALRDDRLSDGDETNLLTVRGSCHAVVPFPGRSLSAHPFAHPSCRLSGGPGRSLRKRYTCPSGRPHWSHGVPGSAAQIMSDAPYLRLGLDGSSSSHSCPQARCNR